MARGRIVPKSLSTDPRLGRVSLKSDSLLFRMWINCDDQGRLSGDPDEIKYVVCPNKDEITKADIPELLNELETQRLIKVYNTSKTKAIQLVDWWEEERRLQWASPSRYPPPEGWVDHLRYHLTPKEIITENWPPPGLGSKLPNTLPNTLPNALGSKLGSDKESSKEIIETEKETRDRDRDLPSGLGNKSPPTDTENDLLQFLSSQKNWRFDRADDLAWLREFRQEYPDFDVSLAKACRDYHSGRGPPKHKGHWKNRFRQWMVHKVEFAQEGRRVEKVKGKRVKGSRPASDYRGKW